MPPLHEGEVVVREATLVDAGAIGLVHRVGLQALVQNGFPDAALTVSVGDWGLEWREWLRAKGMGRAAGILLVAECLHGPVGFVCLVPGYLPQMRDVWSIPHLYVLPAHQKRGLGQRLLLAGLTRAWEMGAARAEFLCPAQSSAKEFLAKTGAVSVGEETAEGFGTSYAGERFVFDSFAFLQEKSAEAEGLQERSPE